MGFWVVDCTGKLETWFSLSIFNTCSLHRTFQSIVSLLMLLKLACCIRIEDVSVHSRNPMSRIVHSLCFLTDSVSSVRYIYLT